MADEDVMIGEVEADAIENNNPIEDFISSVERGDFNTAGETFNSIIGDRLTDALDQAKISVAKSIYADHLEGDELGDAEPEDFEIDDDEDI